MTEQQNVSTAPGAEPGAQGALAAPVPHEGAPAPVRTQRRVGQLPLVLTTVAALAVGLVAGGGVAYAATHPDVTASTTSTTDTATDDGTTTDDGSTADDGTTVPPGWSEGTLPGQATLPDAGSSGSADGSSSTQTTTAATDEQQVGVVVIDTTLGYSGGEAAGTGMVLTSDGLVLTNHHVIEGATEITVTIESTGETYTATVLGYDASADVALLQLDSASGLDTVALDDDGGVTTGDEVTAIGNANGGGELLAAAGAVTATDQTMTASTSSSGDSETLSGLIEFEAAVVSGDSGGPLVDDEGEVVGMTTAASTGGTYTVAYAVDVQDALAIVTQIQTGEETDTVTVGYPGFLGVQLASGTGSGFGPGGQGDPFAQTGTGAVIGGVIDGTPAAEAGLAAGDTITAVDGQAVTSADDLSTIMAGYDPDDQVTVTWTSGTTGEQQEATVTLAQGPVA